MGVEGQFVCLSVCVASNYRKNFSVLESIFLIDGLLGFPKSCSWTISFLVDYIFDSYFTTHQLINQLINYFNLSAFIFFVSYNIENV